MGYGTQRPLSVVQAELRYFLGRLPELRQAVREASPGDEAVEAHRTLVQEWRRFQEVSAEFAAHVAPYEAQPLPGYIPSEN